MLQALLVVPIVFSPYTVSALTPNVHNRAKISTTALSEQAGVDRRTACIRASVTAVAGLLSISHAPVANALNTVPADNEIVKEQRTVVNQLDVNNAPVADYMKFPGLYPTIGGKIATNGPYGSVKDVYKLSVLTKEEKAKIKEYERELTATESTGLDVMRGRDPYRRRFNE